MRNEIKTAVEWLEKNMWEHIEYKPTLEIQRIRKKIQQAKEIEKEYYTEFEVLQLLLKLQQTESYDNLYDWFEENKKRNIRRR
jgi:hypothetical protein